MAGVAVSAPTQRRLLEPEVILVPAYTPAPFTFQRLVPMIVTADITAEPLPVVAGLPSVQDQP